jgi:translation initiation factor eIF-2B subunit delta
LLDALTSASIPTTYALISALPAVLPSVSTVILGTHALHSNGSLYSRAGTALVAMMAKQLNVPVLVFCETYKFSDGILLDSFMKNELGNDPERRVRFIQHTDIVSIKAPKSLAQTDVSLETPSRNLQVLSPLYDLTPPTNITAVVTEVGMIPATTVPMVLSRTIQGGNIQ